MTRLEVNPTSVNACEVKTTREIVERRRKVSVRKLHDVNNDRELMTGLLALIMSLNILFGSNAEMGKGKNAKMTSQHGIKRLINSHLSRGMLDQTV